MSFIIEIASSDYATTAAAAKGGADRIELCANLGEGGTTPSYGLIKQCREDFSLQLYPIIRPRGGDFLYSDEEYSIMLRDVQLCKQTGCDGLVSGLLNRDGSIDIKRTSALIQAAYPLGFTFHRAFDRCFDPFEALEQLVEIGCERILTSGQRPVATEAAEMIARLNESAAQRIIIMPGSGIRKENIKMLADTTGCVEFHSSLRSKITSAMDFIHPAFAGTEDYENNAIDETAVKELLKQLDSATKPVRTPAPPAAGQQPAAKKPARMSSR